jgi:hypothetical protein
MNDNSSTLYCVNHPHTETTLRCNRCEKPICPKCAVPTPTGYRCKECVRGQQKIFDTAQWYDYPLAFGIVLVLSFLGSRAILFLPIGFLTIFLAPIAGIIIGEVARFVIRRRRSKRLFQLITVAAVLGSIPSLLQAIFFGSLFIIIWQGVYLILMTSTVYYRMSGIKFGK